jgi:DNA-binding IclR family transcriptional regulator
MAVGCGPSTTLTAPLPRRSACGGEAGAAGHEESTFTADELRERLPEPGVDYAYSADERATGVLSVAVAVPNGSRRPSESMALTSPVESATESALEAGVPELRRAAGRLSELLEGSVY